MNKKELIKTMRKEIVRHALPQRMSSRPKIELENIYAEAKQLGLIRTVQ